MRDDMMDPGSSSESEGSPPPADRISTMERTISAASSSKSFLSQLGGETWGGHFGERSSKRRGGLGFGGGSRDTKSRRREDSFGSMGLGRRTGPSLAWDQREQGTIPRQKDELVDTTLVDNLRAQFGDPFDDRDLQSSK
ncbi:uncharacterized protein C8Q71DRAFT_354325 [Rhodofomes roseus]|uniref:Uncharacterized protein n=1 Tax=Rhodofomes roseus TaxID=34475 RepID=A0A4Y9Z371_9APHY|nr:uncharacterized protein C8Q71DRAFT_354325 [Rhodofomes roseus]KAH9841923.1 hypothetical protein C8Q71DRAFT_354325 [Rhodofomes roseus]TFY69002.1 hypothetical protein EVJ58_g680 [Rhodofomes roseus]